MSKNGSRYHRLLNTSRWRELRRRQLDLFPFCAECARQGVLMPATDVHHAKPVESGLTPERMEALAYDRANLVSLCHPCHAAIHKKLGSHRNAPARTQAKAKAEAQAFWETMGYK